MIRIANLKRLASTKQTVFRVRWRVLRKSGAIWQADTDGADGYPETWEEWEEEYFTLLRYAVREVEKDARKGLRERGVIDRVRASLLLWKLEDDGERLDDFTAGRFTLVSMRGVARW